MPEVIVNPDGTGLNTEQWFINKIGCTLYTGCEMTGLNLNIKTMQKLRLWLEQALAEHEACEAKLESITKMEVESKCLNTQ